MVHAVSVVAPVNWLSHAAHQTVSYMSAVGRKLKDFPPCVTDPALCGNSEAANIQAVQAAIQAAVRVLINCYQRQAGSV